MAKTQAELVTAVLHELGRLSSANAVPTAEDSTDVGSRLSPILTGLAERRITPVISLAGIDDKYFPDLVLLVAEHVAPMFGRPTNVETLLAAEGRLTQLYRFDRTAATPLVRKVLEQLEILGGTKAVLDATAVSERIPDALAELTADRVFYAPTEDDVPAEAVASLSRYIAASLTAPPLYDVMLASERVLRRLSASAPSYAPQKATYY